MVYFGKPTCKLHFHHRNRWDQILTQNCWPLSIRYVAANLLRISNNVIRRLKVKNVFLKKIQSSKLSIVIWLVFFSLLQNLATSCDSCRIFMLNTSNCFYFDIFYKLIQNFPSRFPKPSTYDLRFWQKIFHLPMLYHLKNFYQIT